MQLLDQFEWDLASDQSFPEQFAQSLASDLGLAGEFVTAVAEQIREQVEVHIKSLVAIGYTFDGSPVDHIELNQAFLPPVLTEGDTINRLEADVERHTPILVQLTELDIELQERERERDARRKKRQSRGRRGVVNLPERDPIKTIRTPAVYGAQVIAPELAPSWAQSASSGHVVSSAGTSHYPRRAAAAAAAAAANAQLNDADVAPMPVASAPQFSEVVSTSNRRVSRSGDWYISLQYPTGLGPKKARRGPSASAERGETSAREHGASHLYGPNEPTPGAEILDARSSLIDGVWHCPNCGVPETLAGSRRKGPQGSKTLCAKCGVFWSRTHRLREAEYTTDPNVHRARRGERFRGAFGSDLPADGKPFNEHLEDEGDGADETTDTAALAGSPSASKSPATSAPVRRMSSVSKASPTASSTALGPSEHPEPSEMTWPYWITRHMSTLRAKYPHDNFEPVLRGKRIAKREWRIRCLDCPELLYKTGPNETLFNFEVHLRNRSHRAKVQSRIDHTALGEPEFDAGYELDHVAAASPAD